MFAGTGLTPACLISHISWFHFFFSFFNGELASTNMQIFRVLLPRKLTTQKVIWFKQNFFKKKNDFIQTQAFDKKYYCLPSMLLLCYNQSKANFSFRSTIVVWRIVSHQFSNLTNYGSSRWDVPCPFTLQIHPGIIQWALQIHHGIMQEQAHHFIQTKQGSYKSTNLLEQ